MFDFTSLENNICCRGHNNVNVFIKAKKNPKNETKKTQTKTNVENNVI